jgi:hypothetical protein
LESTAWPRPPPPPPHTHTQSAMETAKELANKAGEALTQA